MNGHQSGLASTKYLMRDGDLTRCPKAALSASAFSGVVSIEIQKGRRNK
jgi:hypothetical protein